MIPDNEPPVRRYADAARRAAANAALDAATRSRIEQSAGGLAGFRQQVRIRPVEDPADAFYDVLRTGILPAELVPLADFVAALGPKNQDPVMQHALGSYRYFALAMYSERNEMIGAAGFAVFCHRQGPATVHCSYYAVLPGYRGLGLGRMLVNAVSQTALRFVAATHIAALNAGPILHFIEANDIAQMTLGDRLLDEAIALHPLRRDAMWERIGFREISGIQYRQRAEPPIDLALKALLVDVAFVENHHRLHALRPPAAIPADTVRRHVSAFDNLLMNYDAASAMLARGAALADPVDSNLLADLPAGTSLPVQSPAEAARRRQEWSAVDLRLSRHSNLPLDKTMRELRDSLAGG